MKGCFTALITPMQKGKIDYTSLENLIEFQIRNGIDGIVPCGTTGESPTLSHSEHQELIQFCVKIVKKRVKIIAGTGSNSTTEAVSLSKAAQKAGVDGLLIVSPYYNKPTQKGLFQHFKKIANSVSCPIVLYNIPSRTNVLIELKTLKLLSEIDNIVATKESTGNIDFAGDILNQIPKLKVLSGNDSMNLPIASIGGSGCISVLSNLFPKETKQIFTLFHQGQVQKAYKLHHKLLPILNTLFLETNPIPIKAACKLKGLIADAEIRLPLTKPAPATLKILSALLEKTTT